MRSCTLFDTCSCKSCCTILLSVPNKLESKATPSCNPTGNQIGLVLCVRMPNTTLSITRPLIQTLAAGVKPCKRLKIPNRAVRSALVDHTKRRTRGKLLIAPVICFMLKPWFWLPGLLPPTPGINCICCFIGENLPIFNEYTLKKGLIHCPFHQFSAQVNQRGAAC